MTLQRLQVRQLRCLDAVDLELHPQSNFLYGLNGAGKTSVLEAIYLLSRGRSFRSRLNARLVQRGKDGFLISAVAQSGGRTHRLGLEFKAGSLQLKVDGESGWRSSALSRLLPVHVLDPSMHSLVDAGPSERRRFLDWAVFHVEQPYLETWRDYRRALIQRNKALKTGQNVAVIEAWTEQFILAAERVHQTRSGFVQAWSERVADVGKRLLGENISVVYRSGGFDGKGLADALRGSLERDRQRGMTHVGPHRADLAIRLNDADAKDAASRGQQKLIAAALILGELQEFTARSAEPGILLVDDPAAELDNRSLARLITELRALPMQLLMTGISEQNLEPFEVSRVFHVEQGAIRQD